MGDGAAARGQTCPDPHHRPLHPNNFSLDFPHLLVLFQGDTPMDELYECMELGLIKIYIYMGCYSQVPVEGLRKLNIADQ